MLEYVSHLIARITTGVLSWLTRESLRDKLYKQKNENEILRVALQDIARIDKEGLAGQVARQRLKDLYGEVSDETQSEVERQGVSDTDLPA